MQLHGMDMLRLHLVSLYIKRRLKFRGVEEKIFDQNEKDAINGLKAYHFTPDSKKWQHKIFMRKHLNTLAKSSELSKDLEIENSDI